MHSETNAKFTFCALQVISPHWTISYESKKVSHFPTSAFSTTKYTTFESPKKIWPPKQISDFPLLKRLIEFLRVKQFQAKIVHPPTSSPLFQIIKNWESCCPHPKIFRLKAGAPQKVMGLYLDSFFLFKTAVSG